MRDDDPGADRRAGRLATDATDDPVGDLMALIPEGTGPDRAVTTRARWQGRARSRTIPLNKLKVGRRGKIVLLPLVDGEGNPVVRPKTRAECRGHEGPCPFVGCKFHLYLDVNPETGALKINFPDLEPWELRHTCALDVAERGGLTLEEVGEITNLTRERIRQVEVLGLIKLGRERAARELMEPK